MSNVLSRFRSISEMEFYKNATELRCALSGFVMQEKYIPKKWRPILAYPTVNLLNTMMEHIIAANGIYPYSGGSGGSPVIWTIPTSSTNRKMR